jgi:bud site selection protein 20
MGPPRSRKGIHTAKKKYNRKYVLATKHRAKDIDQVRDDLVKRQRMAGDDSKEEPPQENAPFDEDLPAGGKYYCVETARYFMSQDALDKHKKSKQYKQRVRELVKEKRYNQESAEEALGVKKEVLPPVRQAEIKMSE